MLIDGGKGQLSAVCEVLEDAGVQDVPVVGDLQGAGPQCRARGVPLPGGREVTLPLNSPVLFYLQRLRDEAHRFAIGAHRQKRAKNMASSPLDEVPGIGPARKRALLMHFGTARAVQERRRWRIWKGRRASRRRWRASIYDYFHPRG